MTHQTVRTLIITLVVLTILGLVAFNGFFIVLGQLLQMVSLHI